MQAFLFNRNSSIATLAGWLNAFKRAATAFWFGENKAALETPMEQNLILISQYYVILLKVHSIRGCKFYFLDVGGGLGSYALRLGHWNGQWVGRQWYAFRRLGGMVGMLLRFSAYYESVCRFQQSGGGKAPCIPRRAIYGLKIFSPKLSIKLLTIST